MSPADGAANEVIHSVTDPLTYVVVTLSNSHPHGDQPNICVPNAGEPDMSLRANVGLQTKILIKQREKTKVDIKKLNNKKISVSDQLDQNSFSKTYIISMENKLKK